MSTDFPAITRPWLRLQERGECHVEFVEDRPESDLTDDLVARIDADTSVVAVGWVQYATGTTIDVPRLRAATEEAGVRLVLDATQGAGAMRCDGSTWRADLLVSSGYKWLGGPGGVAIGALAPDVVDQTPPLPGWMGAPSPFAFDATRIALAEGARRFTQSTMSYRLGGRLDHGDGSAPGDRYGPGRATRDAAARPVAPCGRATVAGCRSVVRPTPQPHRTSSHWDDKARSPPTS